jgi:predicted nucleic acid-binding protein
LERLPSGSDVFLDTNVFVNGLLERSAECFDLLQRCARGSIAGVTSLHVVNEATHKPMLAEACDLGIISRESYSLLENRVCEVKRLSRYWRQTLSILRMNVIVLPVDEASLHRAHRERATHGLLTNDSLIVAAMREYGLTALASADGGFDHIPDLTRYSPSDLA